MVKNLSGIGSPPPKRKIRSHLGGVNRDLFDVGQVEHGNFFRVLVFDKIAKFSWNLITVYGDA